MGTHGRNEERHEAAQRQEERRFYSGFLELGLRWEAWMERGVFVKSLTLRPPKDDGGDWMVVTRADVEGVPVVGFSSGNSPVASLQSALNKLANGSVAWRNDEYAK